MTQTGGPNSQSQVDAGASTAEHGFDCTQSIVKITASGNASYISGIAGTDGNKPGVVVVKQKIEEVNVSGNSRSVTGYAASHIAGALMDPSDGNGQSKPTSEGNGQSNPSSGEEVSS